MVTHSIPGWKTEMVEVAPKAYAYIQAEGATGISNAGVIVGPDGAMAIDALMVPSMARAFLAEIKRVTSVPVQHLVNTHHHGDHVYGNETIGACHIISHTYCRQEMERTGIPTEEAMAEIERVMRTPWIRPQWRRELLQTKLALPTITFEDRMVLHYGDTVIELLYLGVAHTYGDVVAYLPQHRLLFAGDLAFYYVTPLALQGHVSGWIRVIDRINALDIETIVPGHGPIGAKKELAQMRDYLALLRREARRCYRQGMDVEEAARSIRVGRFDRWVNPERLAPNVQRLYQEFRREI
ncbi:MAG: MBL fold metallo-hydrolase [Dehalococcoidia bacterium]